MRKNWIRKRSKKINNLKGEENRAMESRKVERRKKEEWEPQGEVALYCRVRIHYNLQKTCIE